MKVNEQGAFWTSEVATMLGVQPITVRTWCLKLEALGMTFPRDHNDKRAFTQDHVGMFRFLQSLTQEKKMKLDDAVAVTVERFTLNDKGDENSITGLVSGTQQNAIEARYDALFQSHNALLDELQETKKTQQEILNRLDQQAQRQEQRDQALMQTMRELMEQRRLEANQERKSFWQKLRPPRP
jgi:DNA-binding transcriptional MerR regulator